MQLLIVAVGKARGSAEHKLAQEWLGRLPEGGSIHEIESKLPAGVKRTDDEGLRLLRAVPADSALAILDPTAVPFFRIWRTDRRVARQWLRVSRVCDWRC